MMARAFPKIGLRPFLPADTSILAAIFAASIDGLTEDDYTEAQREAWAGLADDEDAFGKRLAPQLTLIATLQGSPVGFVSLKGTDHLDMLYVHPAAARQGVASALCDAIEKLAMARGTAQIIADASDTAAPFFSQRGYTGESRNTVTIGDEWLANTTMKKMFAGTLRGEQPGPVS